ncbi:endonuclease/exonuclease/phosphatase family protein [Agriterribacter sp.]|uniref:endonuclease/exonuclease/phosphatase family protein n=1 Tax=Agriterribacter sp. TaxID=2821509 RepID=UPI002BDA437E|nr:endonuclease/exonuclease/phosphatase family protein [Agriterribacter sp.]HRO47726.1 endonuclease/exonuclease/phosphatase family protein [Agriterribacter sp.]HRQ17211.1 endonuclease/exonuclease/phosphatase family protein [Agriterribacter sp.]
MKKIVFTLLVCICVQSVIAQKNIPVTIATYNVRYNNPGDSLNAWPNRKENVKALVRFHDFDIFGTQEGLIDQLNGISELQAYARTGHGRDDGKEAGEHSAIFYKKERFKLIESGDFWLSETPEKPGKGWDAKCCNRICSWGKFQDLQTKKTFYFFSVHFDHQGVEARRESGKLMVKKIQEIAKNTPVICVGDFNSTPETEQIQTMQTILNDAYNVTQDPPYGPVGTFNSFRFTAPMKNRIDYIFVSKGINVLKYGVLTDAKDQRYPSDHQPVMIKAVIN